MRTKFTLLIFLLVALTGCSRSPGPLEGAWKADGLVPITIAFRPGETESMGMIEHVDYETKGDVVTVTYKDGLMKGTSLAFKIVDKNHAVNSMYTLRRIQ